MSEILFCRFCAESELACEVIDFSTDIELKNEIVGNISFFSGHNVNFMDKMLPEAVCTNCRKILGVCCKFLIKIRQSQVILREIKNENKFSENTIVPIRYNKLHQARDEIYSDTECINKIEHKRHYFSLDYHNEHRNFEVKVEATELDEQDSNNDESFENPIKLEVKDLNDENRDQLLSDAIEPCTQTEHVVINEVRDESSFGGKSSPLFPDVLSNNTKGVSNHTLITSKYLKNDALQFTPRRLPALSIITKKQIPTDSSQQSKKKSKKDFTCRTCHKIFYSRFRFNEHKIIHTERKRNFKCEVCGKSYLRASELNAHINDKHIVEPQVCPICQKVFQNKIRLNRHAKVHTEIKLECDLCHRKFTSKRLITAHIKLVHSNRTPYLCKFCGKGFKLKGHLTNHENVHKKETPYSCTECGRKFTMWGNCDKHMKRMHGLRLAKTVITPLGRMPINRETGKPDELKNDDLIARLEQKEKIFKCEICNKNFDKKVILKDHQKIAHDVFMAQVCPICNKTLTNLVCLKAHLKTHKSESIDHNI